MPNLCRSRSPDLDRSGSGDPELQRGGIRLNVDAALVENAEPELQRGEGYAPLWGALPFREHSCIDKNVVGISPYVVKK